MTVTLLASCIAFVGICLLLSGFFPQFDIRWGKTSSSLWEHRIPMSVFGRICLGVYVLYISGVIFVSFGNRFLWNVLLLVAFVLLIGIYFIYLRDKATFRSKERKHENEQ